MCIASLAKGIVDTEYLKSCGLYPDDSCTQKGPVAVAECIEEIPCNPCETACRFHVINIGTNISGIPKIDFKLCTGCGACISACSGLAIFVLDKSYSQTHGTVSFPFEYNIDFGENAVVDAVNRKGEVVCKGVVKKILKTKASDRTTVIKLEIPIDFVDEVRGIRRQ
jgi:MinD superfamily P-loop ATPase